MPGMSVATIIQPPGSMCVPPRTICPEIENEDRLTTIEKRVFPPSDTFNPCATLHSKYSKTWLRCQYIQVNIFETSIVYL
jgi:hypothetical protein